MVITYTYNAYTQAVRYCDKCRQAYLCFGYLQWHPVGTKMNEGCPCVLDATTRCN